MSDRAKEAFRRAVDNVSEIDPLSVAHPATVQTQGVDGMVSVVIDEGGPMPGASDVPDVYGLPGTRCKVPQGTRGRISHDNGDPRKRTFGTYDRDAPVTEINFANASINQGAARNGDSVGGGSLVWVQGPVIPPGVPSGGALTYTPFPSVANPNPTPIVWLISGPIIITQISPPSPTPTMQLGGAIDGGSSVVKIGG
jgi:hypothetical protein